MKTLIAMLFFSSFCSAATLECKTFVDLDEVSSSTIETIQKEKVVAARLDEATSYVTEKANNVYMVEAYIPELEIRIYAEGPLETKDQEVIASVWARPLIVDVACKKISK